MAYRQAPRSKMEPYSPAGRSAPPAKKLGEVVFNTSLTGYQEILSDPQLQGGRS